MQRQLIAGPSGLFRARRSCTAYPAAALAYFGLAAASMLLPLIECSFVILDLPLYHRSQHSIAPSATEERRALAVRGREANLGTVLISYDQTFQVEKDGKLDDVIAGIEELRG